MINDVKKLKKDILAEPLRILFEVNPDATQDQADILKQLHDEYHSLRRAHNDLESQAKVLSRQIGDAKKRGLPTADLILDMQHQTKQKEDFATKLRGLEIRLFSILNLPSNESPTNPADRNILPTRQYQEINLPSDDIRIQLLDQNLQEWDSYVLNNKSASFYHLADWRSVIKQTFGHDSFYLYALDDKNNTRGVLPLIHMNSWVFGNFLVSMPYFNYGGAIADSPAVENKLIDAAINLGRRLNVNHIEFRDDISRQNMPARNDKVNMILPLPGHTEDLWQSFSPKLRAQIKRPLRERPEVKFGGIELLDDFYQVFSSNMRDLGTPVYSRSLFSNILDNYPKRANIITISLNHRPVAAAFLIHSGDTMEIPWASTLRKVNQLGINMLMYWEVLRIAIERNCKYFDFGRSSKDVGTYKFKKQWGAIPRQLYWHYWLAEGVEIPAINPNNPKYSAAISVWKHMPVWLTNLIGPYIIKNIP